MFDLKIRKQQFLNLIERYENDVIDFLLKNTNRLILIRGVKFIGKTTMIYKIFNQINNIPIIYHTGCDPTKRKIANNYFEKKLNEYKDKECLVILDEFYYADNCEYFNKHKNFKVLLFVNTYNLSIPGFKHFNLMDVYEQYKREFFKEENINFKNKNIREIIYLFDHQNFVEEDYNVTQNYFESLRTQSNQTQTKIKENGILTVETITFSKKIIVSLDRLNVTQK